MHSHCYTLSGIQTSSITSIQGSSKNNCLSNWCKLPNVLNTLDKADGPIEDFAQACKAAHIKPVWSFYWLGLPYLNIFCSITSDNLHQLRGIVKHLLNWLCKILGGNIIHACCHCLPLNHNVHHFSKGITQLLCLSGQEYSNICHILLGVIVGLPLPHRLYPAHLLHAVCSPINFFYIAQYRSHTTEMLSYLCSTLDTFYDNKDIFLQLNIWTHFNILKLHSLQHFCPSIKWFGSTNSTNTADFEHTHIVQAKDSFCSTNKRSNYIQNMTVWVIHKEKLQYLDYINWQEAGDPLVASLEWSDIS